MYNEKEISWFHQVGQKPPEHTPHGDANEIRSNMRELKPKSWHMEGNKLIGMTEMGPIVQMLPTNYICKGTDKSGLPIPEKIKL